MMDCFLSDILLTAMITIILMSVRLNKISIPVIVITGFYLPHIWMAAAAKFIIKCALEQ